MAGNFQIGAPSKEWMTAAPALAAALRSRAGKMVSLDTPQDQDAADVSADILAGFAPGLGTAQGARDFERARREHDNLGMGLSAAGMVPFVGGMAKVANVARKGKKVAEAGAETLRALRGKKVGEEIISDWNWRPLEDVKNEVAIDKVPPYITDNYGEFMLDQAGRAASGSLTPRDLIKAYGVTRSSVNRGARSMSDDILHSANARPEGYFSEWLLTPAGKAFLDDAQHGRINEGAIQDIVQRFTPFGMAPTLGNDLRWGVNNLPQMSGNLTDAVTGDPAKWREFAQSLHGIGPSKSGFIASLLGRGDMPTFDARQIKLHTGEPSAAASKYQSRMNGAGGDAAVDRLAARQSQMGIEVPERYAPHAQHLMHHAVWDKVAGDMTTHDDVIRAMEKGNIDPTLLAVIGGGGATAAAVAALRGQRQEQKP